MSKSNLKNNPSKKNEKTVKRNGIFRFFSIYLTN